ncbi:hypothetical protein CLV92_104287 [Kineococcus xinjiangensis]|uniref:Uncharacterized protein n=1 Tax=Kineococcus xinjiangensis TaxID=512762 RepID=A0A2S6ITT4_9ACTN|nr:hypothetical protein [Kineococcus xinjiangensis]PPK97466.1 hypothetical protein CLV92_104287 [Kineococcus xinjiangensis]
MFRGTTTRTTLTRVASGAGALASVALLAGAAPVSAAAVVDAPAIEQAVRTSPATAGVDPAAYRVADVRLSAADATWAAAHLAPTGADLEPADVVLHLQDGAWQVADLGSFEVGCGIAPAPVLGDFGTVCPG